MCCVLCDMLNLLYTFTPEPILITLGPINVYWYGIFIVTGLLLAMLVMFRLADYYNIKKDILIDIAFWLIIGGIIGGLVIGIVINLFAEQLFIAFYSLFMGDFMQ